MPNCAVHCQLIELMTVHCKFTCCSLPAWYHVRCQWICSHVCTATWVAASLIPGEGGWDFSQGVLAPLALGGTCATMATVTSQSASLSASMISLHVCVWHHSLATCISSLIASQSTRTYLPMCTKTTLRAARMCTDCEQYVSHSQLHSPAVHACCCQVHTWQVPR